VEWPGRACTTFADADELARELAGLDPDTTPPQPDLIATVVTLLACPHGDAHLQMSWGAWAYPASRQVWDPLDYKTLHTATAYETMLENQGHTARVVDVCRDRVRVYEHQGKALQLRLARSRLAVALHHDRQCLLAEAQIADLLPAATGEHAADLALTGAAILAGCGRTGEAVDLLNHQRLHGTRNFVDLRAAIDQLVLEVSRHRPICPRLPEPSGRDEQAALTTEFWTLALLGALPDPSGPSAYTNGNLRVANGPSPTTTTAVVPAQTLNPLTVVRNPGRD
jgi:hypothetical protein